MSNNLEVKIDRIHRLSGDKKTRAFVDIRLNDAIVIRGLKVIQGQSGEFVAMPGSKGKDDKWYDDVRCLDEALKKTIFDMALAEYRRE